MKPFDQRLNKLERRFGVTSQRILLVLREAARELALDSERVSQFAAAGSRS